MLQTVPAAPIAQTRRFALKGATQDAHDRVEGIAEKAGHFGSIQAYKRYLSATWALRAGFEAGLDASGAADLWPLWPSRRVAQRVEADMADLGMTARPQPVPTFKCEPPELFGVLYVLEGSGLGARIIIGRVSHLGLGADFGARHLHAQAGAPGAWREFTTLLDNAEMTEDEEQACFAAAEATFEAFAFAYRSANA